MNSRVRTAGGLLLALAIIAAAPQLLGKFAVVLLNDIGLATLVVLGLVLVSGVGGAISFGQAAFVGIAAYATAWLTTTQAVSPWLGLAFALLLTCSCAWLIGAMTMRLGGHYLPLSTIAWGLALPLLFGNIDALGSHSGLGNIPPIHLGAWSLDQDRSMFPLIWLLVLGGGWFAVNLLRSRSGRMMRALRGGEVLLASLGADAYRVRLTLFVLAAAYAAVAGWLYAHAYRFVSPTPFSLHASIEYMFMMVVGGTSQLAGAFLGSAVFMGLDDLLKDVMPRISGRGSEISSLIFALIFLLILQRVPRGLGRPLKRLLGQVRTQRPMPAAAELALPRRELPARGSLLLSIDGVVRRFGGLTAVDRVSFDVRAGEIVGLIGPNGAGKSTLFNLITGALPLTDGKVRFLDAPIAGLPQREIALRGIARTFQHVKLRSNMTLLENVALGAHARSQCGLARGGLRLDRDEEARIAGEAMRQLERIGLADRAHDLAGSLPLGTQRLLEIARALAADPVLIVLDEPAAGLRLVEKEGLISLLDTLRAEGMTVLIVEHDMEFVMNLVDRLVVLNFGSKICEGRPDEVRADPQVQAAYLGSDA